MASALPVSIGSDALNPPHSLSFAGAASAGPVLVRSGVLWSELVAVSAVSLDLVVTAGAKPEVGVSAPRLACPFRFTDAATSAAQLVSSDVFSVQRMAVRAVCQPEAAEADIFNIRDCLQVGWVDAGTVAADMIYNKIIWDWANEENVRPPMGVKSLPDIGKATISACVQATSPVPAASILIDNKVSHKAFKCLVGCMHNTILPRNAKDRNQWRP